MNVYDWGIFWEDGNRASLPVPFGPDYPDDNIIFDLDDDWIKKVEEYFPNFVEAMGTLPFAMIIVNPPREATEAEENYWKEMGWNEDQ
jgi:hypothetical protein